MTINSHESDFRTYNKQEDYQVIISKLGMKFEVERQQALPDITNKKELIEAIANSGWGKYSRLTTKSVFYYLRLYKIKTIFDIEGEHAKSYNEYFQLKDERNKEIAERYTGRKDLELITNPSLIDCPTQLYFHSHAAVKLWITNLQKEAIQRDKFFTVEAMFSLGRAIQLKRRHLNIKQINKNILKWAKNYGYKEPQFKHIVKLGS